MGRHKKTTPTQTSDYYVIVDKQGGYNSGKILGPLTLDEANKKARWFRIRYQNCTIIHKDQLQFTGLDIKDFRTDLTNSINVFLNKPNRGSLKEVYALLSGLASYRNMRSRREFLGCSDKQCKNCSWSNKKSLINNTGYVTMSRIMCIIQDLYYNLVRGKGTNMSSSGTNLASVVLLLIEVKNIIKEDPVEVACS